MFLQFFLRPSHRQAASTIECTKSTTAAFFFSIHKKTQIVASSSDQIGDPTDVWCGRTGNIVVGNVQ